MEMQSITSADVSSVPTPVSTTTEAADDLPLSTNIKIGTFHIGSALTDILGSGVWNRIMITELNYAATPVSLLLALNYFLSPLAIWAGQRSDHTNWRGYRRLPWVLGGRAMMALGFLLLVLNTIQLAETESNIWWGGIVLSFALVSIGYSFSGSTYTTLIYDRAPTHQRGRAVGVVWTMLLMGFAFAGVLFSRLLPEYSTDGLLKLFITTVAIASCLWFFSVFGEERPHANRSTETTQRPSFMDDFRAVWSKPLTRLFFLYIGLSFMGAFAQEQVLEPFGGQIFDLSTGETNRFAAFWGTTALLGSVFGLYSHRRLDNFTYRRINRYGMYMLITTFVLLTMIAFVQNEALIRPILLLFGLGLGLWNIGTWGLMVSVSAAEKAGTYFGLWTMASLLFRGGGSVIGAIIRDLSVLLTDNLTVAYGTVFALEAVILLAALILVNRIDFGVDSETSQVIIAMGNEA